VAAQVGCKWSVCVNINMQSTESCNTIAHNSQSLHELRPPAACARQADYRKLIHVGTHRQIQGLKAERYIEWK
jgi:hypothetical protein